MNKPNESRNSEPNKQSPRNIFENFSCSWTLEDFSQSRGLRTDISQKTVVGCPCYPCSLVQYPLNGKPPRLYLFSKAVSWLRKKVDLSKAFDTVSHSCLLIKLPSYGINNKELRWFTDYLFSRTQSVQFGCKLGFILKSWITF